MRVRGVVEGFYGTPWSHEQRRWCLEQLAPLGCTHYVWAAKAEPRQRGSQWAAPFTDDELAGFADLGAVSPGLGVVVALTPGRDATVADVVAKLRPAVDAGAGGVALSCDDLPALGAGALHRDMANALRSELGCEVWVAPTHYAGVEGSPYLDELCRDLDPAVELIWTGAQVVNDRIDAAAARQRAEVTGRAPLLFDNTPVNDVVMGEALHLGPLAGRDPALRDVCSGVVWNPMEHVRASLPTLVSALAWARGEDPHAAWHAHLGVGAVRLLAEATAFRGDPHWPGDAPSRAWWQQVADLPVEASALGMDGGVQPWLDAAREGAALAVQLLDAIAGRLDGEDSQARTLADLGLVLAWRGWRRNPVLVLGAGPRVRPVISQDARGQFVARRSMVELGDDLVGALVGRLLDTLPPAEA